MIHLVTPGSTLGSIVARVSTAPSPHGDESRIEPGMTGQANAVASCALLILLRPGTFRFFASA